MGDKGNGNGSPSKKQAGRTPKGHFASGNQLGQKFPPGQSGNPKGRPKKPSLLEAIVRVLNQADEMMTKGIARRNADGELQRPPTTDELAWVLLEMCAAGNRESPAMFKELLERLDGKVPLKAELTGADGDAIQVRHQRDAVLGRIGRLAEAFEAAADSGEPN